MVALGLLLVTMVAQATVLPEPYHVDTAAYVGSVRDLVDGGTWRNGYETRPMVSLALVPLGLVAGVATLPWTIGLSVAVSLFAGLVWLRRATGSPVAFVGVLAAWATPAALITTTHGKEDPIAAAFLMAALCAAGARTLAWVALAGVLTGMAMLSKELVVLIVPMVLATAALAEAPNLRVRALRVALVAAGAGVFVLAVSPGHFGAVLGLTGQATTGQFAGPFSPLLPRGLEMWEAGVGAPLFFGSLVGLAWPFLETTWRGRLFAIAVLLQAIGLGLFLANITVATPRHFMWPALFALPAAIRAIELAVRRLPVSMRRAWLAPACAASLALAAGLPGVAEAAPAIGLRRAHNLPARFYAGIPETPANALFVGMDNCTHVGHFARRECHRRAAHPNEANATSFAQELGAAMNEGREVYLIPDFAGYDRNKTVARALDARFRGEVFYRAWYEDYHAMSLGEPLSEVIERARDGGRCRVELGPQRDDEGLPVRTLSVSCPGGQPSTLPLVVQGDTAFPRIVKGQVLRLRGR